jgi:hypothetical protein
MTNSERVSIRVGDLRRQLEREAKKRGVTVSKTIREIVSEYLAVKEPDIRVGNPGFYDQVKAKVKS